MSEGVWTIDCQPLEPGDDPGVDFLPRGTVVGFHLRGPTRLAIEEDRADEIGGVVRLHPPLPDGLISGPLGRKLGLTPTHPSARLWLAFDATFIIWRWDAAAQDDPANIFFVEQGATVAAVFLTVLAPRIGVEWELWYQSPEKLLGHVLIDNKSGDTRSTSQIWRNRLA